MKLPRVEVTSVTPVEQGALLGLFSVKIGPLTVHKCRLVRQENQAAWVSPPQEMWTDREGKKRYTTLLEWPAEWREIINKACWDAWTDRENGGSN